MDANQFGFNVRGSTGRTVVWEATTDLVNWTAVRTNVLDASPKHFEDRYTTNFPWRFYRVRYQ